MLYFKNETTANEFMQTFVKPNIYFVCCQVANFQPHCRGCEVQQRIDFVNNCGTDFYSSETRSTSEVISLFAVTWCTPLHSLHGRRIQNNSVGSFWSQNMKEQLVDFCMCVDTYTVHTVLRFHTPLHLYAHMCPNASPFDLSECVLLISKCLMLFPPGLFPSQSVRFGSLKSLKSSRCRRRASAAHLTQTAFGTTPLQ